MAGIVCKQMPHMSIDAIYATNRLHFLDTIETCWVESVKAKLDEPVKRVLNVKN